MRKRNRARRTNIGWNCSGRLRQSILSNGKQQRRRSARIAENNCAQGVPGETSARSEILVHHLQGSRFVVAGGDGRDIPGRMVKGQTARPNADGESDSQQRFQKPICTKSINGALSTRDHQTPSCRSHLTVCIASRQV